MQKFANVVRSPGRRALFALVSVAAIGASSWAYALDPIAGRQ